MLITHKMMLPFSDGINVHTLPESRYIDCDVRRTTRGDQELFSMSDRLRESFPRNGKDFCLRRRQLHNLSETCTPNRLSGFRSFSAREGVLRGLQSG